MKRIDLNMRSHPVPLSGLKSRLATAAPPGAALRALALATAAALLVLPEPQGAYAQTIGELEVRSRLGERFFGAVPVRIQSGYLDPYCMKVVPNPSAPEGAQALPRARIRIGSADNVIIETTDTITSPVVALRLEVGCENPVSRDFVVLGEGANVPGLPAAATTPDPALAAAPAPQVVPKPRAAAKAATQRPSPRTAVRRPPAVSSAEAPIGSVAGAVPTPTAPASNRVPPVTSASGAPLPTAAASTETSERVAELRARSDDHAAALLALEDRLTLLQKQADLLKLQLEQALTNAPAAAATDVPSASAAGDGSAPSVPVTTAATKSVSTAATTPAPPLVLQPPRKEPGLLDLLLDWKVAGGLAALLLGAFVLQRRRRAKTAAEPKRSPSLSSSATSSVSAAGTLGQTTGASGVGLFDKTQRLSATDSFTSTAPPRPVGAPPWGQADQTAEWIAPPTTDTMPLPATASQILRAAPGPMSREFHITQQFQPAAERVVALSSPEEIVQQARTHYMDDGDVFRAIDLLEMAVSVRKDSPRPWQALFAIYRRETMPERFQRLALAYRAGFGEDDNWAAIQALGHAIEPANPLYAAADAAAPLPDDLLERWLGVPLDFTAHLLANEMHDELMSTYPGSKRRKKHAQ